MHSLHLTGEDVSIHFQVVIADESHAIKTLDAQRTVATLPVLQVGSIVCLSQIILTLTLTLNPEEKENKFKFQKFKMKDTNFNVFCCCIG